MTSRQPEHLADHRPANANNIIRKQHTADEKKKIMAQAVASAKAANWNQIIW